MNIHSNNYNNLRSKRDKRLHKNQIESNYLIVDQLSRDMFVKKIEKSYRNSLNANRMIIKNKEKELIFLKSKISAEQIISKKKNKLISNFKGKIYSLENLLIKENKIKQVLIQKLNKYDKNWKLEILNI